LAVALFQPVRTDDTFWHLKIGEILLQAKSFPAQEYLLFTHDPNSPPLYHEWLFQIVLKSIEAFGGLTALRFFLPLCVLCIVWVLLRFFRLFEPKGLLLATLLFLLFSYQRLIQLRPELFSMIFFFLMLHNGIQGRENFSKGRIAWAMFLSMMWANIHSLCLIIFLFWGLWIGCAWIYSKIFKHVLCFDWKGQITGFLCSMIALCANPMGYKLFYFYFTGNARNPYRNVIDEWGHFTFFNLRDFLPLSSDVLMGGMLLLVLWTVLVFIVLVLDLRNKSEDRTENLGRLSGTSNTKFTREQVLLEKFHLFFLSSAAILSLSLAAFAVRFFWLVPFPVLTLLKYFEKRPFLPYPRALCFLLCVVTVWHFRLPGTLGYRVPLESSLDRTVYWKWDYDRSKYHNNAVDFLKILGVEGNIFNPYYLGGFLSYRLNPKVRVFIDGRFEHYTEDVNRDFAEIKNVGAGFEEHIKKYGIDLFFVPIEKQYTRLLLALRKMGWVVLYHDEATVIFCAKTVFKKSDLKQALTHFYKIPVNNADDFSDFLEKDLRAQWAISREQTKNKTPEEIRTLTQESLKNQLQHGFLDDALEFYTSVSQRIPLSDPFFAHFCDIFAQRNQLDWQFSKEKKQGD
jgi:hypothetical protein